MKKDKILLKLEKAKAEIIKANRNYNIQKTIDDSALDGNYDDIANFQSTMEKHGFNKLAISSRYNNIQVDMYNSERGIRAQLNIAFTNKDHSHPKIVQLEKRLDYVLFARRQATYRIHRKCQNLNEVIAVFEKMGTYKKTAPAPLELDVLWRAPNPEEYGLTEDKQTILCNSSLRSAKTIGVCRLGNNGRVDYESIEDPGQEVYFHTDARDFKGRQIHIITGSCTDRYLIATRRGNYVMIEKAEIIFKEGGYPFDPKINITVRDLELIQMAIQKWVNGTKGA